MSAHEENRPAATTIAGHGQTANKLNDEMADDPSVKNSANFRRWSRNLSASRRLELNRLNEIERRRQFLEIRQQNDLFNQMSFTVNNLISDQTSPAQQPAQIASSETSSSINSKETNQQLESGSGHLTCPSLRNEKDLEIKKRKPKMVADDNDVRRELRDDKNDSNEVEILNDELPKLKNNESVLPSSEAAKVVALNDTKLAKFQQQQVNGEKNPTINDCLERLQTTDEQLIRFATTIVPENKRVLCLIVRDKMSKLNAKSYFYPTYYLFIQAVVDIDDMNKYEQTFCLNPNSEGWPLGGVEVRESAENSFSASSSLSADMMIIGNGAGTKNDPLASQIPASGNSYSDNEIYGDGEDDLTGRLPSRTPDSKDNLIIDMNSNGRGGSHVLVHPNFIGDDKLKSKKDDNNGTVVNDDVDVKEGGSRVKIGCPAKLQNSGAIKDRVENNNTNSMKRYGTNTHQDARMNSAVAACQDEDDEDGADDDFDDDDSETNLNDIIADKGVERNDRNSGAQSKEEENLFWDMFDIEKFPYTIGSYGVLLAGRRRKKAKTYLIGPNEFGFTRKNSICKLKSNVLGTHFNAIRLNHAESDDRSTIASISYDTNVLGFKGPRKMRVFIARDPCKSYKNLAEVYKKEPSSIVQLRNMTPSWNFESQSYVLNFHGRVTQASVKNFQLIESEENPIESSRDNTTVHQARQQQQPHLVSNNRKQQLSGGMADSMQQQQRVVKDTSQASSNVSDTASMFNDGDTVNNSRQVINVDESRVIKSAANNRPATQTNSSSSATNYMDKIVSNKSLTYNGSIVMQFGRISNHEFTCDVTYPLTILQAFAIALSSFDSKLACE